MKQAVTPYLFVYGTLKSDFNVKAARALRKISIPIAKANVSGTIYSFGHYPALKLHPRSKPVKGEIVRLKNIAASLDMLDRYEEAYLYGIDYQREHIFIKTHSQTIVCQAYINNQSCKGKTVITTGEFKRKRVKTINN